MNKTDLLQGLVNIHNRASEIAVRGEDAIRMADILTGIRVLLSQLQEQPSTEFETIIDEEESV